MTDGTAIIFWESARKVDRGILANRRGSADRASLRHLHYLSRLEAGGE